MFDQLFKHASTRARHATAPFAEERARYLVYCELRGDSRSQQLRKAHDLLWIARKLNLHSELQVTSDQIRALVVNGQHDEDPGGPNLNLLSTRKRLQGHACAWLRYLGFLCEPSAPIPFGSRLLEYCDWAKQQRGLTESSIYFFRKTIRRFLCWYGPIGRQLSSVHASDIDAYLAFGSGRGWARVTIHNVVAALRTFFRYGVQEGWGPPHLAETIQGPRIYAQERLPAGPTWADVERLFAGLDVNRLVAARLEPLNVQCAHHGPHSLRHACAARLVAQGLSLKEIGDHLGHRSTSATSVYAKVDLLGLREVAAFDLGELS